MINKDLFIFVNSFHCPEVLDKTNNVVAAAVGLSALSVILFEGICSLMMLQIADVSFICEKPILTF